MEFPCRAFLCACGGRYAPPPHAWGIQVLTILMERDGRFIPTCVGNTPRKARPAPGKTVHPHVRGEYSPVPAPQRSRCGSSPRAWGIHLRQWESPLVSRFIPTCVGNTTNSQAYSPEGSVHPHVRGEYSRPEAREKASAGSSPRAWGILDDSIHNALIARFIPTCVGNTCTVVVEPPPPPVHPHVRGEYRPAGDIGGSHGGSSPRAWGILSGSAAERAHPRFIPTCVGNTTSRQSSSATVPVHPHVRGEYMA